ncbi:hypothetical protein ABMA59_31310 [Mesorhizobium sp. CN2-181]
MMMSTSFPINNHQNWQPNRKTMQTQITTAQQYQLRASHMMFFEVPLAQTALGVRLLAKQTPLHHFPSESR